MLRTPLLLLFVILAVHASPRELSGADFDAAVGQGDWIVLHYVPWCPVSRRVLPVWDAFAKNAVPRVHVALVNCEKNHDLCTRSNVHAYPTVHAYAQGNVVAEHHGSVTQEELRVAADALAAGEYGAIKLGESKELGFWGEVTASIDWCEESYEYSYYVSEFWNSFSSLYFCIIGVFQIYHTDPRFEFRYTMGSIVLFCVGLGSFFFHATMLYAMQLADELPMSYGALVIIYMCIENEKQQKYPVLGYLIATYAAITTVIQIIITKTIPIFHEIQFGLFIALAFLQVRKFAVNHPNATVREMFMTYVASGLIAFFVCWIPDQVFCNLWQSLGVLNPQLHAWWHFLMAISVHYQAMVMHYWRGSVLELNPRVEYIWGLPVVKMAKSPTVTKKGKQ